MQIVILGMHRSGTSMLTKLLSMAGAYVGEPEELIGSNAENPKGFWERADLRKLNDELLFSEDSDWDAVVDFSIKKIKKATLIRFNAGLKAVFDDLDTHRSWVIKEPRICLLLELYQRQLSRPFFIHLHRSPLEVAKSLNVRNGIPLAAGIALWERYNSECLALAREDNYIRISHQHLISDPVGVLASLCELINEVSPNTLRLPAPQDIESFIDPKLHRQKSDVTQVSKFLDDQQTSLFKLLNGNNDNTCEKPIYEVSKIGIEHLLAYQIQKKLTAKIRQNYEEQIQNLNDVIEKETIIKQQLTVAARRGKTELERVLESRRWQIGDKLISSLNLIMFKKTKRLGIEQAIVEIDTLLDLYS